MSLWERILDLERSGDEDVTKYSFQIKPGVDPLYVVYRLAQFVIHFVIVLLSFFDVSTKVDPQHGNWYYPKWFLYLSSWSMFANMVQSLMGAVILTMAYNQRDVHSSFTTVVGVPAEEFLKIYQNLYRVALNLAVLTSAIIWVLRKPTYDMVMYNHDYLQVAMLVELGLGSFLMLVDLFVVKFAYTMITGLYSLGVLTMYFWITYVHYVVRAKDRYDRHPFIYPKLNWKNPAETLEMVVFSVFLLEMINAGILWWMCQLRRRLTAPRRFQGDDTTMVTRQSSLLTISHNQTTTDATDADYSGEPPPATPKKRGSKKQDKKTKKPVTDQKLEALDAQIKAMEEDLVRMKHQLENTPQDVLLTQDIKHLQEEIKNKIRERDAYFMQLLSKSKLD